MSQPAPLGRAMPRWSVAEQPEPVAATASRRGLPLVGRRVSVGAPLSASGARSGSVSAPGHEASAKLMLLPPFASPRQAGAVLAVTTLLSRLLAPEPIMPPPADCMPLLPPVTPPGLVSELP